MPSRTVDVGKNVKLDRGDYTAKCSGHGKYKLDGDAETSFNNETQFVVRIKDTSFSNKGDTNITLTW
jgi:hypothetical protein